MVELTIDQALEQGIEAHKAGRLQEADRFYTAILKAQPKHPDANHNMGVLAVSVGKIELAINYFQEALESKPATAQFWISYIDALIKLDKLTDAQAVMSQAKNFGAKGVGFEKLEQRLQKEGLGLLEGSKIVAGEKQEQPNILDRLKLNQALKLAEKKTKEGSQQEATRIYNDILVKFPKNRLARDRLKGLSFGTVGKVSKTQEPTRDRIQELINLYSQGHLYQALSQAEELVKQFPKSSILFNIQGATLQKLKQFDQSVEAYKKAIDIRPDHAEFYNNMGIALKEQGKREEAIEAYTKALDIKPDYAEAFYNMGIALREEGKLDEAMKAYKKALDIKPDFAEVYNNIGNGLYDVGKLDEAIKAYKKALDIKPDYAEACNNIGNTFQRVGKRKKAIDSYNQALALKPDYAEVYNNIAITLREEGKLQEAIKACNSAIALKPDSAEAYNNMGVTLQEQGNMDEAIKAYKKALDIKPDYPEAYNNMGTTLKKQGALADAIKAYSKALLLKADYAEVYYNMGIALQEQAKLDEAIKAYTKALSINADYAEVYYNMGNVFKDQSKLDEAIHAYNKALAIKRDYVEALFNMGNALYEENRLDEAIQTYNKILVIKPDNAEAHNNIGLTLQEQGNLEEAIHAYNKALAFKPEYAEAHRNLSIVTSYKPGNVQISEVERLLRRTDLNRFDRCNLLYTHAKIQEDLGDLYAAFNSYVAGGELRQSLLTYEFRQDEHLFTQIKKTARKFKDITLNVTTGPSKQTPIFILGMPRSGTTLVEQIVSSHSEITGAAELAYVSQFGHHLATGLTAPTSETVLAFRERYLLELAKKANGRAFITDKMPENFRYIALICSAFPEAKIIHVQRSAEATCWSNFKHYFASKGLGYSYNLADTVSYYGLYKELMHFWYKSYNDRMYNLDYDKLTEDQEPETRRLIEYLEIDWEDACLAPQNNNRFVKTASNQQVRRKVYKGSSEAWRKYEKLLGGAFDSLKT